uniref:Reverse transcriptase Ty1/copia-type domain-containing protein n=1 Tax=Tanacetum cinerariifolium TaxID=118510 RepID=A0A6L2LJQ7_TANCI|nr:hypothetical protein [Tanacetum cinerariifolium]
MVYQMDVKSAFLNGKISEKVYVQQTLGFESIEFPNHVCKLNKALYGLKPALGAWYETLSKFLIQHQFVRGSGLDLKAYSDSNYAGCNLDRKSTLEGCQILRGKLVYWRAKKQSYVAMSSAEADAIAISNNPVLHSRTKHIDIRYHFIRYHISKGDIELHFVSTDLQLADIFTKPLAEPSFTRVVAELEADPALTTKISFMGSRHIDIMLDTVMSSSELSSMPDDDLYYVLAFDTIKPGDDEDVDMDDSEHISKEGIVDTFLNASAKFHSLSGHMDHVCEEVSNLYSKIANMESSILKLVSEELKNLVPSLISNALQDQLSRLLTDSLKVYLPSILKDCLPTQLHKTVIKPINKQFNIFHTTESEHFVTLQKALTKVLKSKMGQLVTSKVRSSMQEVRADLNSQSKSMRKFCLDVQMMQDQLNDI